MTRLILVLVFLTLQVNVPKQRLSAIGGWLPHAETKDWRYYSITPKITSWPFSVTGVQPITATNNPTTIRWFTVQRLFPAVLHDRPISLELGSKTDRQHYFVQPATALANGVAAFWLTNEFTAVSGFEGVTLLDTAKYHLAVGLAQVPFDSAYYLPEGRWYKVIGSGDLKYHSAVSQLADEDRPPDLTGLLIDRASADGDCGSGFYYHGQLFIAVKPVDCGLLLNKKKLSQVTLAVPIQ